MQYFAMGTSLDTVEIRYYRPASRFYKTSIPDAILDRSYNDL
jgi:hypothetical protein